MRYATGYLSTLEEGWEKGSIPKPILESIYGFPKQVRENLPVVGTAISAICLIMAVV